jgi:hypothetical protein
MTREEAQNILELIRPGREEDRADPLVREALAVMEEDAELRARFEEAAETDRRISARLASIEVPAGLKGEILAAMRAQAAEAETAVPFQPATAARNWWHRPWVAAAACLAVVFGLAFTLQYDRSNASSAGPAVAQAGVPGFIRFLSEEIPSFAGFDRTSRDVGELRAFLAERGDPSPRAVPAKLAALPSLGCVTFNDGTTRFSMICFKNGMVYHLITANLDEFEQKPPEAPQFFEANGQTFRVWTEGGQVLILTCRGSQERLAEII